MKKLIGVFLGIILFCQTLSALALSPNEGQGGIISANLTNDSGTLPPHLWGTWQMSVWGSDPEFGEVVLCNGSKTCPSSIATGQSINFGAALNSFALPGFFRVTLTSPSYKGKQNMTCNDIATYTILILNPGINPQINFNVAGSIPLPSYMEYATKCSQ